MTQSRLDLPPFPALRAFHAAARHGRFRDAAQELGLTESAISHQVRRLEEFVRTPLFDRQGPRVRLTEAGGRYYADIDPALLQIAEATRTLTGPKDRQRVALTLPPSLAMLWLIPNLGVFERACPGIDLQLVTTTRLVDLRREQVDLAIRHGQGAWPDVKATFLFEETAVPVCVAGYVDEAAAADPENALRLCRLLINSYFPDEWAEWAAARGFDPPPLTTSLRLDSQEQVLAAAEQGLGLAMGRRPLIDARIEAGMLVAPFGIEGVSRAAYHLCWPPNAEPTLGTKRVAGWLTEFAAEVYPSVVSASDSSPASSSGSAWPIRSGPS